MNSRILSLGLGAAALAAGATLPVAPATALPIPATTATGIAGQAPVTEVQYRRYYRQRGVRYYRPSPVGAAVAGAALGIIGGAAVAATAPRYYGYDYGYAPAYGYGYGYAPYGYGYAAPVYAAPGYGYGYYGGY